MSYLYYQWLDVIAQRDQAMAFITVTALAVIGCWLAIRDWSRVKRPFVYTMVLCYYLSLIFMVVAI